MTDLALVGIVALAGTIGVAVVARGETLDPTLPGRARVGEPRGSVIARLDGAQRSRAAARLPLNPRVLWRSRLRGRAEGGVSVDAEGKLSVAYAGGLAQLSPTGAIEFNIRLSNRSALGPALASDGARLVLTSDAVLTSISPQGDVRYRATLEARDLPHVLVAAQDGGALLGTATEVLRVDRHGALVASAPVTGGVFAVLRWRDRVVVVAKDGEVSEWLPSAELHGCGTLGGRPTRAALSSRDVVLGVVENQRLVEFDLRSSARRVLVGDAGGPLDGSLAVGPRGSWVMTLDRQLIAHDREGREQTRIPLSPPGSALDAGTTSFDQNPARDPIVDDTGAVAFVLPGQDVGVVSAAGDLRFALGAACSDPIGLAPAPGRRLALVCRSGSVWMLGEGDPGAEPAAEPESFEPDSSAPTPTRDGGANPGTLPSAAP